MVVFFHPFLKVLHDPQFILDLNAQPAFRHPFRMPLDFLVHGWVLSPLRQPSLILNIQSLYFFFRTSQALFHQDDLLTTTLVFPDWTWWFALSPAERHSRDFRNTRCPGVGPPWTYLRLGRHLRPRSWTGRNGGFGGSETKSRPVYTSGSQSCSSSFDKIGLNDCCSWWVWFEY